MRGDVAGFIMQLEDFPAVNASLNAASTVLIAAGWMFIRRERKGPHITCMIGALVTSTAFLTCYLIYHFNVHSIRFTAGGAVKWIYYVILLTHVVLAVVVLPMVDHDRRARAAPALRTPPPPGPLDDAGLALCLRDRGHRLPDAL